jgi:hypothetical protein
VVVVQCNNQIRELEASQREIRSEATNDSEIASCKADSEEQGSTPAELKIELEIAVVGFIQSNAFI